MGGWLVFECMMNYYGLLSFRLMLGTSFVIEVTKVLLGAGY